MKKCTGKNLAADVDRHLRVELGSPVARAARSFVHPGAPRRRFANDHGLAAGLLARRSWSATAFPGESNPKWHCGCRLAAYSCGAAAVLRASSARTTFPLIPHGNHQAARVASQLSSVNRPLSALLQISCGLWHGEHKARKRPRCFPFSTLCAITPELNFRLDYTFTIARNEITEVELLRRPR